MDEHKGNTNIINKFIHENKAINIKDFYVGRHIFGSSDGE